MHHAGQIEGTPGGFLVVDEVELVLADFFQAEFLGRFAEEVTELVDVVGVGIDGPWRQVSYLHILGHAADVRIESSIEGSHEWFLGARV